MVFYFYAVFHRDVGDNEKTGDSVLYGYHKIHIKRSAAYNILVIIVILGRAIVIVNPYVRFNDRKTKHMSILRYNSIRYRYRLNINYIVNA